MDYSQYQSSVPSGHPFAGVKHADYWSSTTLVTAPSHAWRVNLVTVP